MTDQAAKFWRQPAVLLSLLVFLSIWLVRLWIVWTASDEYFIATTPDDAYYYFGISRNTAMGVGSTFDGMTFTNGYHPLWYMICAALALVFRIDSYDLSEALFYARAMVSVQLLLGLCAVVLTGFALLRVSRRSDSLWVVLAGFATPYLIYAMSDGMESGLVLLFLGAFVYTIDRFKPLEAGPSEKDLAFGALLAMGVMARLDLALLCIGVGITALILFRSKPFPWLLQKSLFWGLPVILTFALYLGMNALHFDSMTPISGQLKNKFPKIVMNAELLRGNAVPLLAGIATISVGLLMFFSRKGIKERFLYLSGSLFIFLHLVSTTLFTDWAVHTWHFTSYWFFLFIFLSFALQSIPSAGKYALLSLLLAGSVLGQWLFLKGRASYAFQTQSYKAALFARDRITPESPIAMSDCGTFGYIRGFGVVNLDGVVNNREYQETLVEEGLPAFLDSKGIGYIAHHAVDAEQIHDGYGTYVYNARSHLYNEPGGSIDLREQDEIYRGPIFNDGAGEKRFMIWERKVGSLLPR